MITIVPEAELNALNLLCSKVFQAYRIRMNLFSQRYKLLLEIDRNYNNIKNFPAFCGQLRIILEREKTVLDIIERREQEVGTNLQSALMQLEAASAKLKGRLSIPLPYNRKLSIEELGDFLQRMISFLKQMEMDIDGIKARMVVEEHFIKEKTSVLFMQYLKAWEQEVKANENMMIHLDNIFKLNRKIIEILGGYRMAGEGLLVGAASGIYAAVGKGSEGAIITSVVVMGLGAVMIAANALINMQAYSGEGRAELERQRGFLKDLERKMAFRRPY
ncbi:MAG: hypothetical protein V1702_01100 [Candidatus Woesearchaeota archaeon]